MSQGMQEWNRKQQRLMLVAMFSVIIVSWLNILLSFVEPWVWLILGLQVALTIISIAVLTRFVLRQRDEYWRERGKDPKHREL
jgi:Flp pilus assembly protein TadB